MSSFLPLPLTEGRLPLEGALGVDTTVRAVGPDLVIDENLELDHFAGGGGLSPGLRLPEPGVRALAGHGDAAFPCQAAAFAADKELVPKPDIRAGAQVGALQLWAPGALAVPASLLSPGGFVVPGIEA